MTPPIPLSEGEQLLLFMKLLPLQRGLGGFKILITYLELHELRYCRRAVGIEDVDEVDTVFKLAHVELSFASSGIHLAHLAARHVEDTDLGIAFQHERNLLASGIRIEAD